MNTANMQSRDVTSVCCRCCISWWLNIEHTSRSGPTQPLTQNLPTQHHTYLHNTSLPDETARTACANFLIMSGAERTEYAVEDVKALAECRYRFCPGCEVLYLASESI